MLEYNMDEILIALDALDLESFNTLNCSEEDVVSLCENLPFDLGYKYFYGCSKIVITKNTWDYVIKLPLGYGVDVYDEDLAKDDDYNPYYPFEGAYYCEENSYGNDYCKTEMEYYEQAKSEGIDFFFAETMFLKEIYGVPVYIQPKCLTVEEIAEPTSRALINNTRERLRRMNILTSINDMTFVASLLDNYDEKDVKKLFSFLHRYSITDLHIGNIGYFKDSSMPCLIDYSDFKEDR